MFHGKSDDEIIEFFRNRTPKPPRPKKKKESPIPAEAVSADPSYENIFEIKLKALQAEYGVDMNNSNDAELLKSLVQHLIQQEKINQVITKLYEEDELDTRTLKNLGDYQRTLVTSITDLQDKLGIARKLRKEKQIDDIGQFIEMLRSKANDFFERKTVPVRCERCNIELARYWLNFPKLVFATHFELECWKCNERVIYTV